MTTKEIRNAQQVLVKALSEARSDTCHVDVAGAVSKAREIAGDEALGLALAYEADHFSYDGRVSPGNKEWGARYIAEHDAEPDGNREDLCYGYVSATHHMTIVDAAVRQYRDQTAG